MGLRTHAGEFMDLFFGLAASCTQEELPGLSVFPPAIFILWQSRSNFSDNRYCLAERKAD